MLNKFTKSLLVATSLAPTLIVMAVDQFATKDTPNWVFIFQLVVIAIALVIIAAGVLKYVAMPMHGARQTLNICKAKNSDKEVLTFLLAYLLPVLSEHKYLFRDFNIPTLALIILLSVAVYHSNAFDFNPMLGMLGYHFYEVEDDDHFPYLLISRRPIRKPCQELTVIQLFDYTFLHIET